jgi:hypothetical protein
VAPATSSNGSARQMKAILVNIFQVGALGRGVMAKIANNW